MQMSMMSWRRFGASLKSTGDDEANIRHHYEDRKSTRLNSSHGYISYAVFCLKKKKKNAQSTRGNHPNSRQSPQSSTSPLFLPPRPNNCPRQRLSLLAGAGPLTSHLSPLRTLP